MKVEPFHSYLGSYSSVYNRHGSAYVPSYDKLNKVNRDVLFKKIADTRNCVCPT